MPLVASVAARRAREEEAIPINCREKDNVVGIRISCKRVSERSLSQHDVALCEQRRNLYNDLGRVRDRVLQDVQFVREVESIFSRKLSRDNLILEADEN